MGANSIVELNFQSANSSREVNRLTPQFDRIALRFMLKSAPIPGNRVLGGAGRSKRAKQVVRSFEMTAYQCKVASEVDE